MNFLLQTKLFLLFSATLHNDSNNLPFHAKDIDIFFKVILNDSIMTIEKRRVKIYFTPYNTIEIWNQSDLGILPRSWARLDTVRNSIETCVFIQNGCIDV